MKYRMSSVFVVLSLSSVTHAALAQTFEMIPCTLALQGRVAWDYQGNTVWANANIESLCRGGRDAEPALCFNRIMHGGIDWGGGTLWQWENATTVCQGTQSANATIACFQAQRAAGLDWRSAAGRCAGSGSTRYVPARAVAAPAIPLPPRCIGSASGQTSVWSCTAQRDGRQRCIEGTVETEACPQGCIVAPGMDHVCGTPPPPVTDARAPVSSEELARIRGALGRVTMDQDKISVIRDFLVGAMRHFTCEQAATLMRSAIFDGSRSEIGAALWPLVIDRENVYLLNQAFTFPTSATTFRARIGL